MISEQSPINIRDKYVKDFIKKISTKDECFQPFNYYSDFYNYKYINEFLLMDQNEEIYLQKNKKYYSFSDRFNEINKNIQQIDNCFDKAPVTKDDKLLLWRGMNKDLGLKIGESIVLKNYTSCTYSLKIAKKFTKVEKSQSGTAISACCFYVLHIGEGIPYMPMEIYSKYAEDEILLPRNLVMTYIKDEPIRKKDKYKFIPYKTIIRHMKITKLNNEISNNKIIGISEPIVHKEEKSVSPIKETEEKIHNVIKKKRCPNGTRKNKDGLCIKKTKKNVPL